MSIPAMDAVASSRVSVVNGNNYSIAAVIHDNSQPAPNMGENFRIARPIALQADGPLSVPKAIQNPDNPTQFSQKFWDEAQKTYNACKDGEKVDFDYEGCPTEFEHHFLLAINHTLSSDREISLEVWKEILKEANWNKSSEAETGDISLLEKNNFEDCDFSEQSYVPTPEEIKEWGLYTYNHSGEIKTRSLWLRFRSISDNIREIPLIYDTEGAVMLVSSDPDFGEIGDNHISQELASCLEEKSACLEGAEGDVAEIVSSLDLSENVEYFIGKAEDSKRINPN